ncbi:MAG: hypothetical protein M1813_005634 [Trichoglossum hirsutum]|nr:MAG: hypothetical protein M1813_005634 [Trichoglossum hirsutum]
MAYPSRDSSPRRDQRYGRHQGRAGGGGAFTDDGYASDMSRKHHPRDNNYQGRRQDHPKQPQGDTISDRLEQANEEIALLRDDINSQKRRTRVIESDLDAATASSKFHKERVRALEGANRTLEGANRTLRNDLEVATTRNRAHEERIGALERERRTCTRTYNADLATFERANGTLQSKLDAATARNGTYEERIRALERERHNRIRTYDANRATLEGAKRTLQNDLDTANARNGIHEGRIGALEHELATLGGTNRTLQNNLGIATARGRFYEERVGTLEGANRTLTDNLAAERGCVMDCQMANRNLQDQNSSLAAEVQQLLDELDRFKSPRVLGKTVVQKNFKGKNEFFKERH